jgi:hypothetical protein
VCLESVKLRDIQNTKIGSSSSSTVFKDRSKSSNESDSNGNNSVINHDGDSDGNDSDIHDDEHELSKAHINKTSKVPTEINKKILNADDEFIIVKCFGCLHLTLVYWLVIDNINFDDDVDGDNKENRQYDNKKLTNDKKNDDINNNDNINKDISNNKSIAITNNPYDGTYLAQFVQFSIYFSTHKSKSVCVAALSFLTSAVYNQIILITHDTSVNIHNVRNNGHNKINLNNPNNTNMNKNITETDNSNSTVKVLTIGAEKWGTFFPGTFSGLYTVCTGN